MVMTLIDVIARLDSFDPAHTIYVRKPWMRGAFAAVASEPETGGLLDEAMRQGLDYFLGIDIALEFLEGWISNLQSPPSLEEKCDRIIQYAINDA